MSSDNLRSNTYVQTEFNTIDSKSTTHHADTTTNAIFCSYSLAYEGAENFLEENEIWLCDVERLMTKRAAMLLKRGQEKMMLLGKLNRETRVKLKNCRPGFLF